MDFETKQTLKDYLENRGLDVNEVTQWVLKILLKKEGDKNGKN